MDAHVVVRGTCTGGRATVVVGGEARGRSAVRQLVEVRSGDDAEAFIRAVRRDLLGQAVA